MKCLAILALLVVVSNALDDDFVEEFMEQVQKVGEICAEETGATTDDIAEIVARQIPPTSHEARCMIFCFNKHFHLQREDGSLDRAGAIRALKGLQAADPELHTKVLKVFIICGQRAKIDPDPCETAAMLAKCAQEEAQKSGLDDSILA